MSGDAIPTTVLVIDDEPMVRKSIVAYLEDSGFNAIEAENGETGLQLFEEKTPALVLTDLQMPGLSGIDVLQSIRECRAKCPVVVISGAGGMQDVIEALRCGAWDYLTKPIKDLAVLEHAVKKCLERSELIQQNETYRLKLEKNLNTLEEDQKAGRSVQNKLLPNPNVNLGGYQFSHSFSPSLYLSGDFVDYYQIDREHVGFYLADVSGHGASSAFVTVLLKSKVTQYLNQKNVQGNTLVLQPHALLNTLSQEMYSAKLGKYLTMVYGVIHAPSHTLTYAVAGHYPNPILLQGQTAHYLEGRGFPVGIKEETEYTSHRLALEAGSQLLIFSDGVMEILLGNQGTSVKEQALLDLIVQKQGNLETLREGLKLKEGIELPDDITILSCSIPKEN